MLRLLLLACWFVLFTSSILAEEVQYTFSHWNEKDGLKNNIVFCFLKDSRGVLWVGTQNGLNRFDGNHFITFRKNREGTSLPNNTINCLAEDPQGNIWGGTVNGVFKFNPSNNTFQTYFAPKEVEDNIISNIQCDQQGNVFAATTVSLLRLKKNESQFKLLTKLTTHGDSTEAYGLGKNRMLLDETNHALWMATKLGILQYRYEAKEWIRGNTVNENPLYSLRHTSALSKSPKGYFWFSDNTSKQLVAFNPATGKIMKEVSFQSIAPDAFGVTTLEDSHGRLWYSTWSYDFLIIDLNNNNSIERLSSQEGLSNTVASNFFWTATEDENGTIWLGTVNGISVCNPGKYLYKASQLPLKIPELSSCALHFIEEDPEDATWWMVTNTNLIIHYFPLTGKSTIYPMKPMI
jgi:ligand-binding sensor domain-containing protein